MLPSSSSGDGRPGKLKRGTDAYNRHWFLYKYAPDGWQIESDYGWEAWEPNVSFEGRAGERIEFSRKRSHKPTLHYNAEFYSFADTGIWGFQKNTETGKLRELRYVGQGSQAAAFARDADEPFEAGGYNPMSQAALHHLATCAPESSPGDQLEGVWRSQSPDKVEEEAAASDCDTTARPQPPPIPLEDQSVQFGRDQLVQSMHDQLRTWPEPRPRPLVVAQANAKPRPLVVAKADAKRIRQAGLQVNNGMMRGPY